MSLAESRQEIADALSTINRVQGFKFRPMTPNAGDAWPLVESLDDPAGRNLRVTWRVVVVLPSDEPDAMEYFDSMHEEISDVLNEEIGNVERIEPGILSTEAGDMSAMILTVSREA